MAPQASSARRPISPSENSIVSSASTVSAANSPALSAVSRATKTCSSCETVCDWNATICEICGEDFPAQPRQVNRSETPRRPGLWRKPWFFDLSPKQCFDCNTVASANSAACPICGSESLVMKVPDEGSRTRRATDGSQSARGSYRDRSTTPLRREEGSQTQRSGGGESAVWRQGQFKIRGSDGRPKPVLLPVLASASAPAKPSRGAEDSSHPGHSPPIFGHLEALFHVIL